MILERRKEIIKNSLKKRAELENERIIIRWEQIEEEFYTLYMGKDKPIADIFEFFKQRTIPK